MSDAVFDFLGRHSSLIITTHENPDPDGLGAELVFFQLAKSMGKKPRIVNSDAISEKYRFIDPENTIEDWKNLKKPLDRESALVIMDSADEYNIGEIRELVHYAPEVFVIDHHEPNPFNTLSGYIDPAASSTCEMAVELATKAGVQLTCVNAKAAFAGIAFDTGFFAFNKTTTRTFRAATLLTEAGAVPYEIYQEYFTKHSLASLLLEKTVFGNMELVNHGKVAVQLLRKEFLESCHGTLDDTHGFINTPLKCEEVQVSIFVKENREGHVKCSLRSKGNINVSKIAQSMGGGGHISAAGFKSSRSLDETLRIVLEKISQEMKQ
jgi:bifunctional oligoribonuclease and PAP phosphatase NrnA